MTKTTITMDMEENMKEQAEKEKQEVNVAEYLGVTVEDMIESGVHRYSKGVHQV